MAQATSSSTTESDRIRLERDLYQALLGLSNRDDPGAFLEETLGLTVRVLGAERGYIEVIDPYGGPTWWRAAGCSEEQVEVIRQIVSRGIIAEAMARGEVVACPSAILDPRFRDRPSVQASKIEAVLCVPIIRATPVGVLYLQGRRGAGSFSEQEIDLGQLLAHHLAPQVESLFVRFRQRQTDHVGPFRKRLTLGNIIGTSQALADVLREVEYFAPLDVTVLVTGETGTGKSQLARVLHENGPRREGPFIEVNSSAIPDALLESELFGALPGSFTGATRRIDGRLAAAQGGTLFLDEVGELSPQAQAKLLTFLDSREYYPLGSSSALTADVRIVAATNVDLELAVQEKRFRSDLFFRLKGLRIRMPSLAERPEDIAPLAQHLCERAQRSYRLPRIALSPGAIRAIEAAEWPGNVRDLKCSVETAAIKAAAERSPVIDAKHLFSEPGKSNTPAKSQLTFQEQTRRFQARLVLRTLNQADWNVTAAARALDLTRTHVYNLIHAFGLNRNSKDP